MRPSFAERLIADVVQALLALGHVRDALIPVEASFVLSPTSEAASIALSPVLRRRLRALRRSFLAPAQQLVEETHAYLLVGSGGSIDGLLSRRRSEELEDEPVQLVGALDAREVRRLQQGALGARDLRGERSASGRNAGWSWAQRRRGSGRRARPAGRRRGSLQPPGCGGGAALVGGDLLLEGEALHGGDDARVSGETGAGPRPWPSSQVRRLSSTASSIRPASSSASSSSSKASSSGEPSKPVRRRRDEDEGPRPLGVGEGEVDCDPAAERVRHDRRGSRPRWSSRARGRPRRRRTARPGAATPRSRAGRGGRRGSPSARASDLAVPEPAGRRRRRGGGQQRGPSPAAS